MFLYKYFKRFLEWIQTIEGDLRQS